MKTVKTTIAINYKGVELAKGVVAELEDAVADRLIAAGNAVETTDKPAKSKKDDGQSDEG